MNVQPKQCSTRNNQKATRRYDMRRSRDDKKPTHNSVRSKAEHPPLYFEEVKRNSINVKPAIKKQLSTAHVSKRKSVSISENDNEVRTFDVRSGERIRCVPRWTYHEHAKMERDLQDFKLYAMEVNPNSRQYLSLRDGDWRERHRIIRKRKIEEANERLKVEEENENQTDLDRSSKNEEDANDWVVVANSMTDLAIKDTVNIDSSTLPDSDDDLVFDWNHYAEPNIDSSTPPDSDDDDWVLLG